MLLSILNGDPILDIDHLKANMKSMLGDITFKEIHDFYKWNLNITVTDSKTQ